MNHRRKIAIVTSTRADWGLLKDIAAGLKASSKTDVCIIATNMHLNPAYGMTADEIIGDGFEIDAAVDMNPTSDSPVDTAIATAHCMDGMARAFNRLQPDLLLILGDRYEMLAVASAATIMRIPIAHIAGGEISEGAFDDSIRHAITKLAAMHLTATDAYRNRVISMGEDPRNVINTGAIGVYNLEHEKTLPKGQLEESIGMEITPGTLLVTLHPATLDPTPVEERCQALLDALDEFNSCHIIFTYPNNDPNGHVIIEMIEEYATARPERAVVVPSLGRKRYLSALHFVSAVVGNSSSGIVEVPSMHIPTVDIGIRQQGRIAAQSVIHCDADKESIADAIAFALSPAGKQLAIESQNPYYRPDTLRLIINALTETPLHALSRKRFIDPYPIINVPNNGRP